MTRKKSYEVEEEILVEVTSVYKVSISDLGIRPEALNTEKAKTQILKEIDDTIDYENTQNVYPILHKLKVITNSFNSKSAPSSSGEEDSNQ